MPTLESSTALGASSERLSASQWRLIILASLGGALEFYDFVVYGVFAQFIGAAFFSMLDPMMSLVMSFAVFAIGYLSRPLGGAVLSWFGDRYGRRRVFIVSVIVVSLSTIGMGLVPTYASWGLAATFTMIGLRLIQGFCLGGELPGSITYVVETVPRRAGFVCGIVFFCVNSGVLLAALMNLFVHAALAPADVPAYGWRIAFVFGGLIGLLGFWLRRKLEETPEFANMKHLASKRPFTELWRKHWRAVVCGILTTAATAGYNGLLFAHMPAYLDKVLHYDPHTVAIAQNVALATASIGILIVGYLGDHVPRRLLMRAGALILVVLSLPFYSVLVAHGMDLVTLMLLGGLGAALINGTFACIIADMFPTRVRFSGVAIAFNLSFTIFSGTAPLIGTWLIGKMGTPLAPAWFMTACALLTFAATFALKGLSGKIGVAE
ncbi:MFS transporter [Paraburkholderia unamae]|uniref:Sugar phosphate permease n=1 Tax=Paraburkholderia unamae TaxID=219649 RepID=A0ABX5KJQ2_9BURK|nr:MFS transporter [Paraburkholderia unamae]PVX75736.1 sugar phosphate permease [Paraburkholderia unamae]RAR57939.1 sugar phosphate permease [Paraburkholderia unamae]CAG9259770.1 Predicted arabinose efflux permease, MFS family [Paraburkholderia unamae]